ncbi:hypothetical protein PR048_013954 [Dryococelus australis]|uniref:DDE-1 domain-containing protein n=1 Tax=Dryococelus australis TaxID=614101 RepID=A0ABQ9HUJ4_9NEOP|nr:hypothetical protein PR048_013954 [Dryococelus australis]
MNQRVISNVKRIYMLNLLQKCVGEGNDLKCFRKAFTVLDAIYEVSTAWDAVKPSILCNAWKQIMPFVSDEDEEVHRFAGFEENEQGLAANIAKLANEMNDGEQVDEENIQEWLNYDTCEPGFEMLSCDDIISSLNEEKRNDSDSEGEADKVVNNKMSHGEALKHLESSLDYVESEDDSLLTDKLVLHRLRTDIRKKKTMLPRSKRQ